jgi:hypothetical protein
MRLYQIARGVRTPLVTKGDARPPLETQFNGSRRKRRG